MGIAGVDEAGRGPVLGPLVIAGVILKQNDLDNLVKAGLTDSLIVAKKKREILFQEILEKAISHYVVIIQPEEIDTNKENGINLNQTEIKAIITILQTLKDWSTVYIDACDRNTQKMEAIITDQVNGKVIAEHFADLKYPVVSAASIIAKVTRDREIEKAHQQLGVDFGSGYPSDPKTIKFLQKYYQEHKELPKIARKSWETSKRIIRDFEQSNLDSYFKSD